MVVGLFLVSRNPISQLHSIEEQREAVARIGALCGEE
jgi:hypothetical protein